MAYGVQENLFDYEALESQPLQSFIFLSLEEESPKPLNWEVKVLHLQSPSGDSIEIKSNNLYAVSELFRYMAMGVS